VAEATGIRNRLLADLIVLVPGYGGRVANLVPTVTCGESRCKLRPEIAVLNSGTSYGVDPA
jgi:hypothetical protein